MRTATGITLLFSLLLFIGCDQPSETTGNLVDYEQMTLDNGLNVVFHIDRSDPVVAVALTAHVGSARESAGRTGFAHLFEHLLFLESENLGKGGLDAMSARIGGSGANGSTNRDRTNYFQTVPKDALEKMIWAEADKIGYFINTVTDPVLAKEKQVVKNEKRQSYDNQPYGHTSYVMGKALYPEGHPYNWQVIGSLDDLDAATLDDVKTFFRSWYTPNNVTLVIAGDFDEDQAREWIHKYFDEIPSGPAVTELEKQPVSLTANRLLFHEDNFAQLPELTLAWPTVPEYHPDMYALDVLHDLLADSKTAPLNEVLIDEEQLTAQVFAYGRNSELAGESYISITGFDNVDLDDINSALQEGFSRFETKGIDPADLNRVKTLQEVSFYSGIQSVLGKAFNLAQYSIFTGDPGYINEDIKKIQSVSADDVMHVYNKYIKGQPFVATSFVPAGSVDLALDGSVRAEVVEEAIVAGAEDSFDASVVAEYDRTPSSFDRTQEPTDGEKPVVVTPEIWEAQTENGLSVYGIEDFELPLVRFELSFDGGHYLDDLEKPGVANMLSEVMLKGTKDRTTAELEEAIAALGATLNVGVDNERFVISGQTLARNYQATIDLVGDILLQQRWDREEFDLAKSRVINTIQSRSANPNAIADRAYAAVTFGEDHILSKPIRGTESSVQSITLDDLKQYHGAFLSPTVASLKIVGSVSEKTAVDALGDISANWSSIDVEYPEYDDPADPTSSTVYFVDVPGAKQSVLRFGMPAMKITNDDYYNATVMNYRLGGGGFASRFTQQLREGKGYTYGIFSGYSASQRYGDFTIYSGVRSNVTLEAADLVKTIMEDYAGTFTEEDLDVTKSFLLKSKARAFETLSAKIGVLRNISDNGLPRDYLTKRDQAVEEMSVEDIQTLADRYLRVDQMNFVFVGDAQTQLSRLDNLGFGSPVLLTVDSSDSASLP